MTLIDLQGKALYSGDKPVKKAYLGGNAFYVLRQSIEPGQFQIPGMYGAKTTISRVNRFSIVGYTWNGTTKKYSTFGLIEDTWFSEAGTAPGLYFNPKLQSQAKTESGGSVSIAAQLGFVFKVYSPGAAGNYVLKYDARTSPGQTNAGYFSKTYEAIDNIGSYQTYTPEWASYYEPPINVINTATGYTFYMRLQREPGALGGVQFANFEFIPANLL